MPELQAYLAARYERCKDAVALLCGGDQHMMDVMFLMWERDYWRSKAEANGEDSGDEPL